MYEGPKKDSEGHLCLLMANIFWGCVFVCVHTRSKQMQEQTPAVGSVYLLPELTLKAKFRKQRHHINHKNKSYN